MHFVVVVSGRALSSVFLVVLVVGFLEFVFNFRLLVGFVVSWPTRTYDFSLRFYMFLGGIVDVTDMVWI